MAGRKNGKVCFIIQLSVANVQQYSDNIIELSEQTRSTLIA